MAAAAGESVPLPSGAARAGKGTRLLLCPFLSFVVDAFVLQREPRALLPFLLLLLLPPLAGEDVEAC